jgi:hypothetical protein
VRPRSASARSALPTPGVQARSETRASGTDRTLPTVASPPLRRFESRRGDSNPGPLHYEGFHGRRLTAGSRAGFRLETLFFAYGFG